MDPVLPFMLVDTCDSDGAFLPGDGPPPVVRTLLSADQFSADVFAPPVLICREADMALARGAFLVSGDGDGRVIACSPPGTPALRRALAAAFGPRAFVMSAGEPLDPGADTALAVDFAPVSLIPASLKGVWVPEPNAWAEACGTDFGDEGHG